MIANGEPSWRVPTKVLSGYSSGKMINLLRIAPLQSTVSWELGVTEDSAQ